MADAPAGCSDMGTVHQQTKLGTTPGTLRTARRPSDVTSDIAEALRGHAKVGQAENEDDAK